MTPGQFGRPSPFNLSGLEGGSKNVGPVNATVSISSIFAPTPVRVSTSRQAAALLESALGMTPDSNESISLAPLSASSVDQLFTVLPDSAVSDLTSKPTGFSTVQTRGLLVKQRRTVFGSSSNPDA